MAEEKSPSVLGKVGKDLLKAFNTGVSYFIPIVVVGGVFLAFSLATVTAGKDGIEVTNPLMQSLNLIGMAGIKMMIPVLAAYIAYSLGGKPALAPGFVLGYLASNPVPVGEVQVSTGFLGAMVLGVAAGYLVQWMKSWKVNSTIRTIMPILIIPSLSSLALGMLYIYVLAAPLGAFMDWLTSLLSSLQGGSAVVLGIVIGLMTAFDMGGPVNKAAYVTGTALLTEALAAGVGTPTYEFGTNFMAAVSAACIVPPLITTFAVVVGKKYFTKSDFNAGLVNFILGCTHITEGAIPFMTKNIWPVMPIMMIGSSIGSILTLLFGVHDPAPHGGFLVLPVVDGGLKWVLAILIGAVVGGILFVAFKAYEYRKNGNKLVED